MAWTLGIAVVIFALDAASKWAAVRWLGTGDVIAVPYLLTFRLSYNEGIALGMLQGNTLVLLVLPPLVIFCGWYLLRNYQPTDYMRIAKGLILGGFIGNFIERLIYGRVVDMIFFPFLPWFICNVADVAICFGVVMVAVSLLLRPKDWREKNAEDGDHSAG
ncbi:MAG: signal peptidase II [Clostridiales bacterium]|nr:signal peptidase II [Clostridiales bacterium]